MSAKFRNYHCPLKLYSSWQIISYPLMNFELKTKNKTLHLCKQCWCSGQFSNLILVICFRVRMWTHLTQLLNCRSNHLRESLPYACVFIEPFNFNKKLGCQTTKSRCPSSNCSKQLNRGVNRCAAQATAQN